MNSLSHIHTDTLLALATGATEAEAADYVAGAGGLRALLCAEPCAETTRQPRRMDIAYAIAAAREVIIRALERDLQERPVLSSPNAMRDYLRLRMADLPYEVFMVLYLDAQNRLIEVEEMFRGTLTQTSVYAREVVKGALAPRRNAAAVVFVHNHPSGVPEPSRADELLTQNLKAALALVDVKVLDHFVVANGGVTSFAERGLL